MANAPAKKKKKKRRLDSNTKFIVMAVAGGGALLVVAIVLPIIYYTSKNKPDAEIAKGIDDDIPMLPIMLDATEKLENGIGKQKDWWKWNKLNDQHSVRVSDNAALNGAYALQVQDKLLFSNTVMFPGITAGAAYDGKFFAELDKRFTEYQQEYQEKWRTALPTQPLNVKLTNQQIVQLGTLVDSEAKLLALLNNLPEQGAFAYMAYQEDGKTKEGMTKWKYRSPYDIPMPHLAATRRYVQLLYVEGILKIDRGDEPAALQALFAIFKLAGYLSSEPFAVSQIECAKAELTAVDLLERIMAQVPGLPDETLKLINSKLQNAQFHNEFMTAVRAERGAFDKISSESSGGKMPFPVLPIGPEEKNAPDPGMGGGGGGPSPMGGMMGGGDATSKNKAHAWMLQYMNQIVTFGNGPSSKLIDAIKQWNKESPRTPLKARGYVPNCEELAQLYLKKVARVRCAIAAVAAERFRLYFGGTNSWPTALVQLVRRENPADKDSPMILNSVPTDPYTDQPLIYRPGKKNEGKVIYSVGEDKQDDQALFDNLNTYQNGSDIGFRLWEPVLRKQ